MSRYALIDLNSIASLSSNARLSERAKFSSVLDSGSVPLLPYGPRPASRWRSGRR